MGRFSQAISEGDGISVVPLLRGDVAELASQAESSGAEAVAVGLDDVASVRDATALPIVVDAIQRPGDLDRLGDAAVDACLVVFDPEAGDGELIDEVYPAADRLGIDCAVEVRDEEALAEVLERFDPEILVIASAAVRDEEELEHVLDLLPDIPAGKLVIARAQLPIAREQALALERAGVDAVLVGGEVVRHSRDFATTFAELTGS